MAPKPPRAVAHLRLARPFSRLATAYLLGLLSTTSPRLVKILFLFSKRKLTLRAAWLQLSGIFRQALALHRFPTFCAVLVGGSTLLQIPIKAFLFTSIRLVKSFSSSPSPSSLQAFESQIVILSARFIAALLSASVSFTLLNNAPPRLPSLDANKGPYQPLSHLDVVKPGPFDDPPETISGEIDDATLHAKSLTRIDLAGRTMDLTLFAVIRALDVCISSMWAKFPSKSSKLRKVSNGAPTALFCFSAATIMHAWFYSPSRLPQTYNIWISTAAELDNRLLLALRHARFGTWLYGKDTGMAPLLGSMARAYGLPEDLGDPAKTIPIPCELVHMGRGKSCEKHALWRFWRGWTCGIKMYAPLQVIVLARHMQKNARPRNKLAGLTSDAVFKAVGDATRSSAFLGAFISLFYYGVCLSRTRVGPKIFSTKTVTPQMWDSGLCVLAGCLLCGFSVLVEQSRKRLEVLFFVLPRAAATWFPRRYLPEHRWREHVAFALSAAIVLTTVQEDPRRVRGVLGKLLQSLLKTK